MERTSTQIAYARPATFPSRKTRKSAGSSFLSSNIPLALICVSVVCIYFTLRYRAQVEGLRATITRQHSAVLALNEEIDENRRLREELHLLKMELRSNGAGPIYSKSSVDDAMNEQTLQKTWEFQEKLGSIFRRDQSQLDSATQNSEFEVEVKENDGDSFDLNAPEERRRFTGNVDGKAEISGNGRVLGIRYGPTPNSPLLGNGNSRDESDSSGQDERLSDARIKCYDIHAHCGELVKQGWCARPEHELYMLNACARSCGKCIVGIITDDAALSME